MIIYRVKVDSNKYQWLMPDVNDDSILDYAIFDCSQKKESFGKVNWFVFNPKLEKGDFFNLGSNGVFAFGNKVRESDLFPILEQSGQIIPILLDGQELYILNVLECVNALNEDNTQHSMYADGSNGRIISYSFYNRFSESSLFKIPQTCQGEILTYSGLKFEMDEFKTVYEKNRFTGLIFENIYEDQQQ